MKFDINNYKGKYVMHCKTEEEARDFCNYLHSVGRRWYSGKSYLDTEFYYDDKVYYFNEGACGHVRLSTYTILEWSDFMNKEFTKADLKTGDVILHENGKTEIVNRELGMLITPVGWNDLNYVRDDLTDDISKAYDIVAVRRPHDKADCVFHAFKNSLGTLVYERKEVEEMTLEEVCQALGKEIKIIKG